MYGPLSPLDGRYLGKTEDLRAFFSEEALMQARVQIEVEYFIALSEEKGVKELKKLGTKDKEWLLKLASDFPASDAKQIKTLEKKTNHDVKAVEYFLQEKFSKNAKLKKCTSFIHFGLTSEDVNNLAYGILIEDAVTKVILPELKKVYRTISSYAMKWQTIDLLSLTHGQPATPSTVGREFQVFAERLEKQIQGLQGLKMYGKLGGAVGNFSAHKAAYPEVNWVNFGRRFVRSLNLDPLVTTTQINPHDDLAELSHTVSRINTILLDLSRDMWLYISRGVFKQKLIKGEVGSSTMPHKVNPIDFENAEGNLGLSTALFLHFAEKLPVSRLQRDLSDSTVQRSIGVAFGYHLLSLKSLQKGLSKIALDKGVLKRELDDHPELIAEAIQTVLRKNGDSKAYDKLKEMTRGERVTREGLEDCIIGLDVPKKDREKLIELL